MFFFFMFTIQQVSNDFTSLWCLIKDALQYICNLYNNFVSWFVAKMGDFCVFLQFPFVCADWYASVGTCFNSTSKKA